MSTIVYQDILQSCFESQIIETTTLKLKIPSSIEFGNVKEKCNYQVTKKSSTTMTNLDCAGGGWSCLQNLSNISKESGIYVHPSSKKCSYSSRLSEKSLQLCTESLGSETGTDIIDTNILSFSSSYSRIEKSISPPPTTTTINDDYMMTSSSRNCKVNKRRSNSSINKKFPPPLTTIRGLNSVQFKPHREDGRLIIKAVETPLTHNYLQAERSNGRLRLCFYKNEISASTSSNFNENEELDEIEDDVIENDIVFEEEEEIEEKGENTEEKEEESDMYNLKWDIDGNKFDVEGEMEKRNVKGQADAKKVEKGTKLLVIGGSHYGWLLHNYSIF
ncbi:hypothetical protein H5410_013085 [Solanum commersonii]|uniref:FAF domain-containing protein n=1 Tax=Solanum commersonii TaxID=4109 RepID=A0A9J6AUB1_SOLCO|nr:hypothetical protein H5410_013085 [Solanum commersonii]